MDRGTGRYSSRCA